MSKDYAILKVLRGVFKLVVVSRLESIDEVLLGFRCARFGRPRPFTRLATFLWLIALFLWFLERRSEVLIPVSFFPRVHIPRRLRSVIQPVCSVPLVPRCRALEPSTVRALLSIVVVCRGWSFGRGLIRLCGGGLRRDAFWAH